jgi:hypothetical protein
MRLEAKNNENGFPRMTSDFFCPPNLQPMGIMREKVQARGLCKIGFPGTLY